MLVSVIVPVYNCIACLPATVAQIMHSGLSDFEILLIDDGSTDGTALLCDRLPREYANVRCIHQKNSGVSAARNLGIAQSRGEYILFFDADDGVDAGALCHAEQILRRDKPDMLIFGMRFEYYYRNRLYRTETLVYPEEGPRSRAQVAELFDELYQHNALSPVWNKLIRREIIMERNIRFSTELIEMEDFVFSVDCLSACASVYLLPEAVYRYRQSEAERNTYNRLCRIPSLTAYMEPFRDCMDRWQRVSGGGGTSPDLTGRIYTMFLLERIRFAGPKEIAEAARDMDGSIYAEAVRKNAPELFRMLADRRFRSVWLRNGKRRIRHWLAVRVKYLRSFGRRQR